MHEEMHKKPHWSGWMWHHLMCRMRFHRPNGATFEIIRNNFRSECWHYPMCHVRFHQPKSAIFVAVGHRTGGSWVIGWLQYAKSFFLPFKVTEVTQGHHIRNGWLNRMRCIEWCHFHRHWPRCSELWDGCNKRTRFIHLTRSLRSPKLTKFKTADKIAFSILGRNVKEGMKYSKVIQGMSDD